MILYIKLDTNAISDHKVIAAGPEGFAVFIKGLLYSKLHLTDGFVPQSALPLLALGVKKLKEAGTMFGFDGQNCDHCEGWDGYSRRCQCGNRRVSWTIDGTFEKPYLSGVAY